MITNIITAHVKNKNQNKNIMSTINFNQCNFHIGNIISAPVKPFGHLIEESGVQLSHTF